MITGANGTIGADLVNYFSKDCKVYAFYRTKNKIVKNLRNENIKWIKQDLKNNIKVNIKPDLIVHSVVTHPFSKKSSYKDYINSNIIALKNVIDFSKKKKVKNFIYLSSFKVYGDIKKSVLNENNVISNPTLLGATKLLSEQIIQQQKLNYVILRLPGVLSYLNRDPRRPWVNKIINDLKKNRKINIYNSNKPFNNFIDTIEIAKFIKHLLKFKLFKKTIVNFSTSNPIKLKKLIIFLKKNIGSRSKIIYKKEKTENYYISNKKLDRYFNFKPFKTLNLITKILKSK